MFGVPGQVSIESKIQQFHKYCSTMHRDLRNNLEHEFGLDITEECEKYLRLYKHRRICHFVGIPLVGTCTLYIAWMFTAEIWNHLGSLLQRGYLPTLICAGITSFLCLRLILKKYRDLNRVILKMETESSPLICIHPIGKILNWVEYATKGLDCPMQEVLSKDIESLRRDAKIRLSFLAQKEARAEQRAREEKKDLHWQAYPHADQAQEMSYSATYSYLHRASLVDVDHNDFLNTWKMRVFAQKEKTKRHES